MTPAIAKFLALDVSGRQAEARRLIGGNKADQRRYHHLMAWLFEHDPDEYRALVSTCSDHYRA